MMSNLRFADNIAAKNTGPAGIMLGVPRTEVPDVPNIYYY